MTYIDGINAEAMDEFLAALRSGNYTQTKGVLKLKNGGGHCCLGVATDMFKDKVGITEDDSWAERIRFVATDGVTGFTALMPNSVMDHLGIPDEYRDKGHEDGSILVLAHAGEWDRFADTSRDSRGRELVDVVSLNDRFYKSFAEIADRLEETFKVSQKEEN